MDLADTAVQKTFEKPITRPTLYIWGSKDPVIAPTIIPLQAPLIQAPYQELNLETGHSLLQAKTDTIVTAILRHFGN